MIEEQVTNLGALTQRAAYVYTAMARATYEVLEDDEGIYAEIPGFDGVWANEPTLDECRAELLSTLEDWMAFRLQRGLDLPTLDGIATPVAA